MEGKALTNTRFTLQRGTATTSTTATEKGKKI
jgi:hypothetical protein